MGAERAAHSRNLPHPEDQADFSSEERSEIVGQLRRSLALLRGCYTPGTRAEIERMIANLRSRLNQLLASDLTDGHGASSTLSALIPSADRAFRIMPAECRAYAIQCESLASKAKEPGQRNMLLALARLWRALAAP